MILVVDGTHMLLLCNQGSYMLGLTGLCCSPPLRLSGSTKQVARSGPSEGLDRKVLGPAPKDAIAIVVACLC